MLEAKKLAPGLAVGPPLRTLKLLCLSAPTTLAMLGCFGAGEAFGLLKNPFELDCNGWPVRKSVGLPKSKWFFYSSCFRSCANADASTPPLRVGDPRK